MGTQTDGTVQFTYFQHQLDIFFNNSEVKYLIVPKGRRSGITEGAEKAFIEYCLDGITPLLWVDTINGNIERYYERYFLDDLKKLPKFVDWDWNAQKKILKINDSLIDFRSADAPESIEGFGYKKIFLNEAGIILKDDYLYSHAILPMLLDFPDSQLIAAGVPKGKLKKDGSKHKFFELWENTQAGKPGYKGLHYTSYDNPLLDTKEINDMIGQMTALEAEQEIFGHFVEYSGNNPFAAAYLPKKHERDVGKRWDKQLFISIDFNLTPFAVTFWHHWQDEKGWHTYCFDEASIEHGSIDKMIELIKLRYTHWLPTCKLTGDAMGKRGELGEKDNASLYLQLQRGLRLNSSQIVVPGNPTHENSKADVNFVLYHHPDFAINPVGAPGLCYDMRNVQWHPILNQIVKRDRKILSQRADSMDTARYFINTFLKKWIHYEQNRAKNSVPMPEEKLNIHGVLK